MDPNKTLESILEYAKNVIHEYEDSDSNGIDQDEAGNLAQMILNLHAWLSNGGFFPDAWVSDESKKLLLTTITGRSSSK